MAVALWARLSASLTWLPVERYYIVRTVLCGNREPIAKAMVRPPAAFAKIKIDTRKGYLFLLAEAEGFEPPWAFTQTVFKTASL